MQLFWHWEGGIGIGIVASSGVFVLSDIVVAVIDTLSLSKETRMHWRSAAVSFVAPSSSSLKLLVALHSHMLRPVIRHTCAIISTSIPSRQKHLQIHLITPPTNQPHLLPSPLDINLQHPPISLTLPQTRKRNRLPLKKDKHIFPQTDLIQLLDPKTQRPQRL